MTVSQDKYIWAETASHHTERYKHKSSMIIIEFGFYHRQNCQKLSQVMSPHHSDQMSQRATNLAIFSQINSVSQSVTRSPILLSTDSVSTANIAIYDSIYNSCDGLTLTVLSFVSKSS